MKHAHFFNICGMFCSIFGNSAFLFATYVYLVFYLPFIGPFAILYAICLSIYYFICQFLGPKGMFFCPKLETCTSPPLITSIWEGVLCFPYGSGPQVKCGNGSIFPSSIPIRCNSYNFIISSSFKPLKARSAQKNNWGSGQKLLLDWDSSLQREFFGGTHIFKQNEGLKEKYP